jgi:hypothetical protein
MSSQFNQIIEQNLGKLASRSPSEMCSRLPAVTDGDGYAFRAFGQKCVLKPDGIWLDGQRQTGPPGIVISLYALHASDEACRYDPPRAFRELPDSMPYAGAFATHAEHILLPHVASLVAGAADIWPSFDGREAGGTGGDGAFWLNPLPRIGLCFIFYLADDDFPASAKVLFSANADQFLPTDALADLAEYTSRRLIEPVACG